MSNLIELIRAKAWRLVYTPIFGWRYFKTEGARKRLPVMDSIRTCSFIAEGSCSVSRFGDGEFQIISHWLSGGTKDNFVVDSFQEYDPDLASRLSDVLSDKSDNLLVCIPYPFKDASVYSGYDRLFFKREYLARMNMLSGYIPKTGVWGDTDFTRFYLHRKDIPSFPDYIRSLKKIWDRKDVLIVEGEFSRLGVGNDLFDNAARIQRIICPSQNAYSSYNRILDAVLNHAEGKLALLALGQTASVLAYDLSRNGIRAIDLGHIDIEYEWYRMGAKEKVPVPNKYVNEVKSGRIKNASTDDEYSSQIIVKL